MIIVRLSGGLGNQMFQHAAATALASHLNCELLWDLSAYAPHNSPRSFELDKVFGLANRVANASVLRSVLGWRGYGLAKTVIDNQRLAWIRPKSYTSEPYFHYWPDFFSLPNATYLDGYWQSERYFSSINALVRKAFAFSLPLSHQNQAISDKIRQSNGVSVHVRRGDYISNPLSSQVHSCCTLDYYQQASVEITDRVGPVHFYIFSDDPQWARNNLKLPGPCTYIEHNTGAISYVDMQLMSLCRNHIIANSSFSWWGAWLGSEPDKIVIAPKKWFSIDSINTCDLYCSGWVQR